LPDDGNNATTPTTALSGISFAHARLHASRDAFDDARNTSFHARIIVRALPHPPHTFRITSFIYELSLSLSLSLLARSQSVVFINPTPIGFYTRARCCPEFHQRFLHAPANVEIVRGILTLRVSRESDFSARVIAFSTNVRYSTSRRKVLPVALISVKAGEG